MSNEFSASELVTSLSSQFAVGMIRAAIPNEIDGLKLVHRRILVTLRSKPGDTIYKSAQMLGALSESHPHGPDSGYQAAARLGQVWEYNPPLLDFRSESAGGTYADPKPGAYRYTRFRSTEFMFDLFFKNIDYKVLPVVQGANPMEYEPAYLIPAIPTTLLYANSSIGYGYPSHTVPHNLGDVCDLVVAYAHHRKTSPHLRFDYTKHIDKFLPEFPTYGILTNHEELLAAYRRGEFNTKIHLDGLIELTQDSITVKTLPYGGVFERLESQIQELMASKENKGGWFDRNIQSVLGLSNDYDIGDVTIRLKRGVNVFEAWEQLRKKIKFSGTYSPILNYERDNMVRTLTPPELLISWYQVRYNAVVATKKIRIMQITEDLRRVEALLVISDYVDEAIAILKTNTKDDGVRALMTRFDLTWQQASYLSSAPLHTISSTTIAENEDRRRKIEARLVELKHSFSLIPDEIAAEATAIKKKYNSPRRTRIPKYLGYVRIGSGCIQYESLEEVSQILDNFPNNPVEIHTYDGPHLYKVSDNNKLEAGSIPKITTGDIYGLRNSQIITVNITEGTACCVKGFIPGTRDSGYFYTTPRSKVIYKNGDVKTVDITEELSLRKTICRGASTNAIYVYPDVKQDHYLIAMNSNMPNNLVIQRIGTDTTRLNIGGGGDVMIVHSVSNHIFINLPPTHLNRVKARVAELIDIEALLEGKDRTRIDLGQKKYSAHKQLRLL